MKVPGLNSKEKGRRGEDFAALYLSKKGYDIISRNFRSKWGEIDIIAGRKDTLTFFEIKYWGSYSYEDLEYAINKRKQSRIVRTAKYFLYKNPGYYSKRKIFDVIYLNENTGKLRHIAEAFSGEE